MREEIISKLNQEFSQEQIKNRRGPGGKRLDYIEAHAVIARLNEALAADWSFEIIDHKVLDTEVVVIGKLTVHAQPEISKTAFGSQQFKRSENGNESNCLGDDLKAAASNALKKAATLLGVGLHLYDKDARSNGHTDAGGNGNGGGNGRDRDPSPAVNLGIRHYKGGNGSGGNGTGAKSAGSNGNSGHGNGSNGNGGAARSARTNGNGQDIAIREPNSPLTINQLKAIFRIGKSCGLNNQTIKALVKERFGKDIVDQLTKQEASDLISSLQ